MRYSQLRAFHRVATEGGFTRAAKALNQTQPALSEQVRRLELAHDTLLFRRDGRQVTLTESGAGLLRLTRAYFETEERIADYLDRARAAPAGTLRIVADAAAHVAAHVGAFRARHPQIFVSIASGNTEQVLTRLRNYDAEIGVLGSLPDSPDLDVHALGTAPIVAIAARGLMPTPPVKLTLADLRRWPLIFRETGSKTRALLEAEAKREGIALTPVMEVEGREAMQEIVATGAGLGFVSKAELAPDPRLIALTLSTDGLRMPEAIVTLKARAEVQVIRAFLRGLPAAAPE